MDREGFKNRLKQYKQARKENPGLKYWEWKNIPKYGDGTNSVQTNSEVPWWQRVINFGEKVQPLQQTDIDTYRQKRLHDRYKASSFLMAAAQAYGVDDNFGYNNFMKRFDPQNVFLLNEQDQTTIMEQNGYKKIDTTKENDPYGIVRSAAKYHNQYKHVPVYELIEHSDTTINRDQLIPLFTQSEPERHYLKDAAHHSAVVYGDPNTGKIYRRFYDMNDYGPVNGTKHGFIKGVGDIKTFGAKLLDKLGTPFVQRTGFIPYAIDDAYRYAGDEENKKIMQKFVRSYHINNGLRPPTWTVPYEE